jgi:hypothetical protein
MAGLHWLPFRFRLAVPVAVLFLACGPDPEAVEVPRSTLFVGIDVSGSFRSHGRFDDAMAFAAYYIHARLNGFGNLEVPRALFVGTIGGDAPGEPHAFRPIHDFQGKSVEQIEANLRAWFQPRDQLTDFNAFFERAATLAKRQNLVLAPITLVILSDGEPDLDTSNTRYVAGEWVARDTAAAFAFIDMSPLDFLARNVTVRLLYPDPTMAVLWERHIPRSRVRLWTVDRIVMEGWRRQLRDGEPPEAQPELWKWLEDNVDFRVRRTMF